jgi:hypothetical protein
MNTKNSKGATRSPENEKNLIRSSKNSATPINTNLDQITTPRLIMSRKDSSAYDFNNDILLKSNSSSLPKAKFDSSWESIDYESLESLFRSEVSDNVETCLPNSIHSNFEEDFRRLRFLVYKQQPALIRPVVFNQNLETLEFKSPF